MTSRSSDFLAQMGVGVTVGSVFGLAHGACRGTIVAFRMRPKIPGLLKIRYIGRTSVTTAAAGALFMLAGTLMDSGKSY